MQCRGITVPPSDHWVESHDRATPTAWHSKQNIHNLAMMTTHVCDAVCHRNFRASIQSLPSQPYPFRLPFLTAVTDSQAYTQAEEIMEALHFCEEND
eukprot:688848-Pyramimonas_sp.AAC.1